MNDTTPDNTDNADVSADETEQDSTPAASQVPSNALNIGDLGWPRQLGIDDTKLEPIVKAVAGMWETLQLTLANLRVEELRRHLVNELPITATFAKLGLLTNDDGDRVYTVEVVFDDELEHIDDDLCEAIDDDYSNEIGADIANFWQPGTLILHLETGALYDAETGEAAPWCQQAQNLPVELCEELGDSPGVAMVRDLLA